MPMHSEGRGGDIVVPGSIANLGGGFDTLAVAVQLYLRVRVLEARHDGRSRLVVVRSEPRIQGVNAIERGYSTLARLTGRDAPSVFVEATSDIPIGAGLGSSAAATVAGMRVLEQVTGSVPVAMLLAAGQEVEGHLDNIAASVLGGLVSVQTVGMAEPIALRWPWPSELRLVVATPSAPLQTSASRRALPDAIPREQAVFNLQRVVALLHALSSRDFDALREAVADAWHQPARVPLVPGLVDALAVRDPDVLGVFLAGAGPSIAALATSGIPRVERLLSEVFGDPGSVTMRVLSVDKASYRSNDSRRPPSLSLTT